MVDPSLRGSVFVTLTHPPGPDIDTSQRTWLPLQDVYEIDVDVTDLGELSDQLRRHFEELAERMESITDEGSLRSHDYPADRMYM